MKIYPWNGLLHIMYRGLFYDNLLMILVFRVVVLMGLAFWLRVFGWVWLGVFAFYFYCSLLGFLYIISNLIECLLSSIILIYSIWFLFTYDLDPSPLHKKHKKSNVTSNTRLTYTIGTNLIPATKPKSANNIDYQESHGSTNFNPQNNITAIVNPKYLNNKKTVNKDFKKFKRT